MKVLIGTIVYFLIGFNIACVEEFFDPTLSMKVRSGLRS